MLGTGISKQWTVVFVSAFCAAAVVEARSDLRFSVSCASKSNTSCDECLKDMAYLFQCMWCITSRQCVDYPGKNILPSRSPCPLPEARWVLCSVNFQSLIITLSVFVGLLLVALLFCCFRCGRYKGTGNKREDEQEEGRARERKSRKDERRTEMKIRHDEIRQKYGITKGKNSYSRMEDK